MHVPIYQFQFRGWVKICSQIQNLSLYDQHFLILRYMNWWGWSTVQCSSIKGNFLGSVLLSLHLSTGSYYISQIPPQILDFLFDSCYFACHSAPFFRSIQKYKRTHATFMCPFCTGYERDHAFWCRQLCFTCIFTTTCRYYANVCIKPFGNKTFCSSLIHCIVSTTTCQNVLKGE